MYRCQYKIIHGRIFLHMCVFSASGSSNIEKRKEVASKFYRSGAISSTRMVKVTPGEEIVRPDSRDAQLMSIHPGKDLKSAHCANYYLLNFA